MKTFHRAVLAAATTLLTSAGAFAADLNNGGSLKDNGDYVQPTNTRPAMFYARGDFTYSSNEYGSLSEAPNYSYSGNSNSIGNSHAWGGGLGMYFSPSVRGDLTLDWAGAGAVNVTANNSLGNAQAQFGIKRMVGLANLYYDFDTRSRFTPYLGVGLGFSRNTTTAGTGTAVCNTPGCTGTATMTTDSAAKTNAAAAFMAGFSAKLHDRWSLDAGYRFLYTGDARTSDLAVLYANGTTATSPSLSVNDLYAHEFRVGLRMDLR